MVRQLFRATFAVSIVTLAFCVGSPAAHAIPAGQSITISPTYADIAVNPGSSMSGSVKLIDTGTTDFSATIAPTPYGVTTEQYDQSFQQTTGFRDASSWFHFSQTSYAMKPHMVSNVPYTITVPPQTGPGGYYAAVFAETTPSASASDGVQTRERVGTIFYIRVNGAVQEGGSLASWRVAFFQVARPIKATIRVTNSGDVHFVADSTIVVRNVIGNRTTQVESKHFVLPGTTRAIPVSWLGGSMIGLYKVGGSVTFLQKTYPLPDRYVLLMPVIGYILIAGGLLALTALVRLTVHHRRTHGLYRKL